MSASFGPPRKKRQDARRKRGQDDDDEEVADASLATAAAATELPSKRRKNALTSTEEHTGPAALPQFVSSGAVVDPKLAAREAATRTLQTETDFGADSRAQYERNQQIKEALDEGTLERGVYRGQRAYADYTQGNHDQKRAGSKFTGALGPNRAAMHARVQCQIDYQPHICKDYKETGYCGFGDSCKFLHDRSDYKTGWQMEAEWREKEKIKQQKTEAKAQKQLARAREIQARIASGEAPSDISSDSESSDSSGSDADSDDDDDQRLPLACAGCKKPWELCLSESNPAVITKCKHYFCESCFFASCVTKCPVCGAATEGIMRPEENILAKIKSQKEQRLKHKQLRKNQKLLGLTSSRLGGGRGPNMVYQTGLE